MLVKMGIIIILNRLYYCKVYLLFLNWLNIGFSDKVMFWCYIMVDDKKED